MEALPALSLLLFVAILSGVDASYPCGHYYYGRETHCYPRNGKVRQWCRTDRRSMRSCHLEFSTTDGGQDYGYPYGHHYRYSTYSYGLDLKVVKTVRSDDQVTLDVLQICASRRYYYYYHYGDDDIHTGQAICRQLNAGDVYYTYRGSYVSVDREDRNRHFLATLSCGLHQTLDGCTAYSYRSGCYPLQVTCRRSRCYDPKNSVYSHKYGGYYQICDPECGISSDCLFCPYYYYYGRNHCFNNGVGNGQEYLDPHIKTFDNRHYNFQGKCRFVITRGSSTDEARPFKISVEGKYEECGLKKVTCQKEVTIRVGPPSEEGYRTTIKLGQGSVKYINGEVNTDSYYINQDIHYYKTSSTWWALDVANVLKIQWDGEQEMKIEGEAALRGKVAGLMGNFDGDASNDFTGPDGEEHETEEKFADSWAVDKDGNLGQADCDDTPAFEGLTDDEKTAAEVHCRAFNSAPFTTQCNKTESRETAHANCLVDVATAENDEDKPGRACASLQEFADECAEDGQVFEWHQNVTQCQVTCPENQTLRTCSNPCQTSCSRIEATEHSEGPECVNDCVDGCVCDFGKVFDHEGNCVEVNACPDNVVHDATADTAKRVVQEAAKNDIVEEERKRDTIESSLRKILKDLKRIKK